MSGSISAERRNAVGIGHEVQFAELAQFAQQEERLVALLQHVRARAERDGKVLRTLAAGAASSSLAITGVKSMSSKSVATSEPPIAFFAAAILAHDLFERGAAFGSRSPPRGLHPSATY